MSAVAIDKRQLFTPLLKMKRSCRSEAKSSALKSGNAREARGGVLFSHVFNLKREDQETE